MVSRLTCIGLKEEFIPKETQQAVEWLPVSGQTCGVLDGNGSCSYHLRQILQKFPALKGFPEDSALALSLSFCIFCKRKQKLEDVGKENALHLRVNESEEVVKLWFGRKMCCVSVRQI